jgi:hypothetical protein
MSSKFIIKSRFDKKPHNNQLWSEYTWQSKALTKEDEEEQLRHKERVDFNDNEKIRIESIPLEELSFKDLYKFPFRKAKYGT